VAAAVAAADAVDVARAQCCSVAYTASGKCASECKINSGSAMMLVSVKEGNILRAIRAVTHTSAQIITSVMSPVLFCTLLRCLDQDSLLGLLLLLLLLPTDTQ
jgi:hypothetical protein